METTSALLFSAYMIPISLLDNILRPLLMGRGLKTPILVILIGVIGGTLSQGITGLCLGPIMLDGDLGAAGGLGSEITKKSRQGPATLSNNVPCATAWRRNCLPLSGKY